MTSRLLLSAALIAALATTAAAQPAGGTPETTEPPPPAAATTAAAQDDPDRDVNLAQPDFSVITLPTTLRVPRFKSAFRITHRFGRPLGAGDFGDLVSDLFGLDSGSLVGLEYRFGLFRGAQVGINRTSNRDIQFFGQYELARQGDALPFGLAIQVTAEGTNNFRDSYSPGLGVILARELGDRGAVYVEPLWVNNTNSLPSELADDNSTFLLGLAARLRVRPTVYVLLEGAPRVAGYDPGVNHLSFAIEKRSGGHTFQLNFSNGVGTTLAQVARGGVSNDDWFIGFNITRKLF